MNARAQGNSAFKSEVTNFVPGDSLTSSIFLSSGRVRVSQPRSKWVASLEERFNALTELPMGWDGYSGRAVSFTCAQFAANLIERLYTPEISAPQLVPGGDGTVQVEWHCNQYDLEIVVFGPYEVSATRNDLQTGETQELDLQTDFSELGKWIADLARPRDTLRKVRA